MQKVLTIFALLILTSCSISEPTFKNMSQFQSRKAFFNNFSESQSLVSMEEIEDFSFNFYDYLDHEHLIIHTQAKRSYLITLYLSCVGLESANNIRIHQTFSDTLLTKKDAIGNIDHPKQRCTIRTIHRLNEQQVELVKQLALESQSKWPDIETWDG